MFEAMRQTAFLHKLATRDPRALPAATRARAGHARRRARARHGAPARLARAGQARRLLIVGMSQARQTPLYDPVSHLVYVTRGDDVETTIVNGKVLMENRRVLTLDEGKVLAEARRMADEVGAQWRYEDAEGCRCGEIRSLQF